MATGKRTHRRDRVVRRFLLFVLFLGLLVALAPAVVGGLGLHNTLLAGAAPAGVGSLRAGGARLGWWSPVELIDVELTDPRGAAVFRAARVRVDRTLMQLAGGSGGLGTVRVERPMLAIFVRPDGSSLEDLLAALGRDAGAVADGAGGAGGGLSSSGQSLVIEVTGGAVQIVETAGAQRSWVVDEIDATIDTAPAIPTVAATAIVYSGVIDNASAPLRAAGQVAPPRDAGSLRIENTSGQSAQRLALNLERAPLAVVEPWLHRVDPTLRVAGTASGSGTAEWRVDGALVGGVGLTGGGDRAAAIIASGLVTSGTITVSGFGLDGRAVGDRPVRLAAATAPWRVRSTADGRLAVERFDLSSELGEARLRGVLNAAELSGLLAGDWSAPRTASVEADLDLARLARVAPGVVRLRPGTAIQSGRARLTVNSAPLAAGGRAAGRRLTGTLDTSDLTALAGGRVIEWNRPLVLRGTATHGDAGLRVDEFVCQSDFLNAKGRTLAAAPGAPVGAPVGIEAETRFDLDRLTRELGRFIDLTGWRLAGRGRATVRVDRPAADRFSALADVDLTDLAIATPERVLVNEPRLVGRVQAAGRNDAGLRPVRFEAADVQVTAGGDTLMIKTTGPVAANGSTPVEARLSGALGDWLERLRLVLPGAAGGVERLVGGVEAGVVGSVSADRVTLSDFNLKATDLSLDAGALRVREPQVTAVGALAFDRRAGWLGSDRLRLESSAVGITLMRGERLNLAWGAAAQQTPSSGGVAVVADLARLSGWLASSGRRDAVRAGGVVRGDVRLTDVNGRVVAALDLKGERLSLTQSGAELWRTASATLRGEAAYASGVDQLTFRNLALESPTLRGAATGQIDRLRADAEARISGTLDYDLAQWAPVIAAKVGRGLQIAGRDRATFQLSGPLASTTTKTTTAAHWSQRLSGRVDAPWASAVAYGLPIGAGRLGLALSRGVVRADPLVVALGAAGPSGASADSEMGRLSVQPAVRLDPGPMELGLPAGPVLTNVRITPQISEEMLKYVAPVLQGATQSEGVFSLTTNGVRAPLGDLKQVQATGQFAVQSVRVVPGPNTAQWVGLAQQVEAIANGGDAAALLSGQPSAPRQATLLSIEDRTVGYRVAGGRVYHDPMPLRVGGVTMLSSGSVGFDETLDLMLTVPIQDRWVEGRPLLVGLRGQSVQVPVRGTFDRPQIDRRAVRNLSRRLVRDAASGALENELRRGLDKLFGN